MARRFYQQCVKCKKIYSAEKHIRNCSCSPQGLLPFVYEDVKWSNFPDSKYGDSVWRFHELLPIHNMDFAIELEIKKYPLIKCKHIAKELGVEEVYIKLDSLQPTESFKDREAFVTLSRLREMGYRDLVSASTGDSGIAYCRAASIAKMHLHMFVPKSAKKRWEELYNRMVKHAGGRFNPDYISLFYRGETLDEAIVEAYKFSEEKGLPLDYWFYNQLRTEGMKTLCFEVLEDLGRMPDWYIQAVGSGTGIFSFNKACREIYGKSPNFGAIQPAGCAPMVMASRGLVSGVVGERVVENIDTYVSGIAIPIIFESYPHLRNIGTVVFEDVFAGGRQTEIKEFPRLRELFQSDGIPSDKAGLESLVALAGAEKLVKSGKIHPGDIVVIGCTGRMRLDITEPVGELK